MKATQAWEQHHKEGKTNAITGRFFGTKPVHELYDTTTDPDNVHNLVDDPKYAADVKRLSAALDQWQVDNFDAALLPESEIVKLAEDAGKTIYDYVRDPKLYDLKRYQAAAASALLPKYGSIDLSVCSCLMAEADPGLRYWGVVGLFQDAGQQDGHRSEAGSRTPC